MKTSQTKLILLAALFFVLFDNLTFFAHVVEVYPMSFKNMGFLVSLPVVLTCFIMLFLLLVSSKYTIKPVLISLLLLSSLASYFMNNYNVVIDYVMIQNLLQTPDEFAAIPIRINPDGSVPTAPYIAATGLWIAPNGKTNVGLGRPLIKED